jgi:hypothetical protein
MKKPKPSRLVWETREGSPVLLQDMTDRHLVNALHMVERSMGLLQAEECMLLPFEDSRFLKPAEEFLLSRGYYRELYQETLRRRLTVPPITCWYVLGDALPFRAIPARLKKALVTPVLPPPARKPPEAPVAHACGKSFRACSGRPFPARLFPPGKDRPRESPSSAPFTP